MLCSTLVSVDVQRSIAILLSFSYMRPDWLWACMTEIWDARDVYLVQIMPILSTFCRRPMHLLQTLHGWSCVCRILGLSIMDGYIDR